jgi:prolyl-tRNA synthetase
MLQSTIFTKVRKEAPADEVSKNAQLLIRAGFVHKHLAGVYEFLPLGLKVLSKIIGIIREEMNAVGGSELLLTALQNPEHWQKTNRWSDEVVDNWFKTKLASGSELGLGFTHEEAITPLLKEYVSSYKDLPRLVYQFQTKFRNEVRAKSGIMRSREFIMKDLYSFAKDTAEHQVLYDKMRDAYVKIFDRLGIGHKTYVTFASGGSFAKYSHEFQALTSAGEDIVYVHEGKKIAINKEVLTPEVLTDLGVQESELREEKAVEVGNIFSLGTRFSEALGLMYKNEKGESVPVVMGSYGIGPARVMGTIVELLADEKGLVWPAEVAPFDVHVIRLSDSEPVQTATSALVKDLESRGFEVLVDDRDMRPGEKFAEADMIGIPHRVVVSEKSLAAGGVEYKARTGNDAVICTLESVYTKLG